MSDQMPVVYWGATEDIAGSDCACPDRGEPFPEVRWSEQEGTAEHDCACPDPGAALGAADYRRDAVWQHRAGLLRVPIDARHEAVLAGSMNGVGVLNRAAGRILDEFASPRSLPEAQGALAGLDSAEVAHVALNLARHGMLRPAEASAASCLPLPRTLTAWLHVTNRCNLRCAYCYVRKDGAEMDESTGRAAVEALFRSAARHGFRAVKLKYAGGEPVLNFARVRSIHAQAVTLGERLGLPLSEVLLTNGIALTDSILGAVLEMGMSLAVSLDGLDPAADAARGGGTCELVMRAVERAIGLGLRPHITVTVTARNVDRLGDVVAYAVERSLPINVNFYRQHADGIDGSDLRAEAGCLINGVRDAFRRLEACRPNSVGLSGLLDRTTLAYPHHYPCGAGRSYVVVDHGGRISRCHMEMNAPVGDVWRDDPLSAVGSAVAGSWRAVDVDDKPGCSKCEWRYWCAGGCPLLTHRSAGRDDGRSPYCEVYRALLPELLRLEGLRILHMSAVVA